MIYLDNAASTIIHHDVLDVMLPYLKDLYGNPSSIHRHGRLAEKAIKHARRQISNLIHASPDEILLTSGGTESNNAALYGLTHNSTKKQIITTSVEHEAILEPCKRLEESGFNVSYLPVDKTGMLDPDDLADHLTEDTCLVSVMLANNEVGTIQPIKKIAKICHQMCVPLHSDAVQAAGKIPLDVSELGVDLMSVSSHKLNGPKGVGALYVRQNTRLDPLILGGGQEAGLRSGTENVAGIVGFGKACEMALENLHKNNTHLCNLRDYLTSEIVKKIPHVSYNGSTAHRLPNNAHFTFLGVNGEDLIIKLDEHGISASTGSACSVKTQKASHVLQAMDFSHEQISGSLRLSIGIFNTKQEIDRTVDVLTSVIRELRRVSPFRDKYGF